MLKKVLSVYFLLMIHVCSLVALEPYKKIYIDEDEVKISEEAQDAFHIHIGNNNWICTNAIHKDTSGFFTYENEIHKNSEIIGTCVQLIYEKKWRCPYCYQYWPIGIACQNRDCPSKYK